MANNSSERKLEMKWVKFEDGYAIPIKSWCESCEDGAVNQP